MTPLTMYCYGTSLQSQWGKQGLCKCQKIFPCGYLADLNNSHVEIRSCMHRYWKALQLCSYPLWLWKKNRSLSCLGSVRNQRWLIFTILEPPRVPLSTNFMYFKLTQIALSGSSLPSPQSQHQWWQYMDGHYVSINTVLKVGRTGHFLNPSTQSFADLIYWYSFSWNH